MNKYPIKFLGAIFTIIIVDIFDLFSIFCKQMSTLTEYWQNKFILGGVIATLVSFSQSTYPAVVMAIFWLILIDIFTKWVAISNEWLLAKGYKKEDISYLNKVKAIVLAYNDKKINSSHLSGGFISKVLQYTLLIFAANQLNIVMTANGFVLPVSAVVFVIGFVCYNELLSICENLRDSDVKHMDALIELMTTNIFNKLKK